MFYKITEEYSSIIRHYKVNQYKRYGSAYSLVAKIEFIDDSILYIKDYLFLNGKRKYSFHWQKENSDLILRWDNSPHHGDISTFPHHKHSPDRIESSYERNLKDVFELIYKKFMDNG